MGTPTTDASTAEFFLGFVDDQTKKVNMLENAEIHSAASIQPTLELLKKQGAKFEIPLPYSPEFNRIEVMWLLMKHPWLSAKRPTKEELEQAIAHVFNHFSSLLKIDY